MIITTGNVKETLNNSCLSFRTKRGIFVNQRYRFLATLEMTVIQRSPKVGLPNDQKLPERRHRRSHQSADGCWPFFGSFPGAETADLSDSSMEI